LDKAQHTLIRGIQISPRNLHRQRHLAEISRKLQDYPTATKAYKEVLTLATYSRHESPDHYINLAETLNTAARKGTEQDLKNPSQQALQTAQKMSQRYNEEMPLQLKSRMIQAESLDIQGLTSARDGELTKLHSMAMRHVDEIKPDLALAIAGTHYRFEKQHIGDEWVDALRQHHANDNDFQQKLLMSQSEPVSVRAKKRAAEHNGLGNQAYKSGDFVAALSHFSKALEFSPRHPGLILNMAQVHLKLHNETLDRDHIHRMNTFLGLLQHLPKNHYQYERFQALVKRCLALQEEDAT
ncbi:MAG: tetratricopeptide repeat protein, partial [Natronospirillum sp.]